MHQLPAEEIDRRAARARVLGRIAFEAGRKRLPVHDREIMELLVGVPVGQGNGILHAWLVAWDHANLAAPVEGLD